MDSMPVIVFGRKRREKSSARSAGKTSSSFQETRSEARMQLS